MMDLSNTELAMLAALLGALGVLWRVYSAINKIKGDLVAQVKDTIKAEGDGSQPMELVKQPLRVQWEKEFVSRPDFEAAVASLQAGDAELEADIKNLGGKMDEVRTTLQLEGSRRASSIHNRVDDVARTLSAVDERSKQTNQAVMLLGEKMDRFLERAASMGGKS
jgi:methyl-accepting chemotaxis protein